MRRHLKKHNCFISQLPHQKQRLQGSMHFHHTKMFSSFLPLLIHDHDHEDYFITTITPETKKVLQ